MRNLIGLLCVCALCVVPVVGCSETAGTGGSGGDGGNGGAATCVDNVCPCTGTGVVAAPGLLDLDDIGPHIAEQHGAKRPGQDPRQIDHTKAVEGAGF